MRLNNQNKSEAGNEEEDIKQQKRHERAYAKSLKDTPTSISQETKLINKSAPTRK